ncbi:MAG TPA: hypothetical protein VKA15_02985 [Isosphaeraceae bacterium]|nr:hypothetical protein [Isosphaeraceae bacterium]
MSIQPPAAINQRPRWPWVVLGLGLVWTALIRAPLILNAEDHLDSDLAVDGLTLLDAVNGQWRWHYPGTPYMGIQPVLTSYPQALVWGANAVTLVSGGTVIWMAVVAATFWLEWRAFGPVVAAWAIVPLVFSSIGTIWLSGRITGGHLLTLVWHTMAFVGLHACLTRGGWLRSAALGLWCGLGLYLDAMFLFTLAGLVPAALLAWFSGGRSRSVFGLAAVFLVALGFGLLPREIGRRVDPYDAYPSQFETTFESRALIAHGRLLALHCLPRLIAGTELSELEERVVGRENLAGDPSFSVSKRRVHPVLPRSAEWLAVSLLAGFVMGIIRLARDRAPAIDPARKATGRGVFWSGILIVGGFLVNRNIFDSDNYRYLVYLLTPWSLGFGLLMNDLARRGRLGLLVAGPCAGFLVAVMTAAAFHWYQEERHYINAQGIPVRRRAGPWRELAVETPASPRSAVNSGNYTVPSDVTHVFGGYWDVYRMAFLSGGRISGIPFPMYPNRFHGWSRGLGPGQGKLLALRLDVESRSGSPQLAGRPILRKRRRPISVPNRTDWLPPLLTVWKEDGRDPAEVERLQIVVPSPEPARR